MHIYIYMYIYIYIFIIDLYMYIYCIERCVEKGTCLRVSHVKDLKCKWNSFAIDGFR